MTIKTYFFLSLVMSILHKTVDLKMTYHIPLAKNPPLSYSYQRSEFLLLISPSFQLKIFALI